jgi:hypothetical protein
MDMNRSLIKTVFDRYKSVGFMKDMPEFIIEIMAAPGFSFHETRPINIHTSL